MRSNYLYFIMFLVLLGMPKIILGQDGRFKKFKTLSSPEKLWVITHPFIASKALKISEKAREIAQKESGMGVLDNYTNGGKLDAFRHAYWMASLGLTINPRKAIKLGEAHEKGNKRDFKKHRMEDGEIPDLIAVKMDLWNNKIGINIAKRNQGLPEEEIKSLVKEEIKNGNCKIIKKNADGYFVSVDNKIIKDQEWKGMWINKRCLVKSNYNN